MTPTEFTAARKALAMSQSALAKAMGVTRETICRIERGETVPAVYQLAMWWLLHDHAIRAAITAPLHSAANRLQCAQR